MNIIDKESVQLVAGLFTSKGYNVEITPEDKDPFDILLRTEKGTIAVEVKARNCNHDAYPNMRVGISKWVKAREGLKNGTLIAAIVVCLYLDGWTALGDFTHGRASLSHGPLSTHFPDTTTIPKTFWDVPFEALLPPPG